ncbi:SPOR domain-containing protein [Altererythrobacter arenosus]|uniref:SPOR domain-containing protein n=1 Tax=Altererythrobacter arenosus TaxID=3032592 RepID=A0ABY8FXQ2_9SPHN|nr:SPOR domain-containing protein [Altererythrobacter sp. CAU 1644]WFL78036.1 SPOR domain-containing protein [Altererythrobacter sp. CAU 1644]
MMAPASEGTGAHAELALGEDESLPWLEADEYEDAGGVDTARIIGFAVVLLALLAAIIGGVWWFTSRDGDVARVADGSTIEAPDQPYKEKPADAGGKQFAGTGNVAPGVGEGKVREGKLKEIKAAPTPSPEATGPSIAVRTTKDKIEAKPVPSGVGVQVGAYGSKARAEEGWVTLQRQTEALQGVSHRVVKGEADIGTVYRLQAVAGDLAAARALCSRLKTDGVACQVKR